MKNKKYIIPQISAQSILASAKQTDDGYSFYFDTTDMSKEYLVEDTLQDDCPIFYQAMLVLGEDPNKVEWVSDKLRDVFVYIDFSGIFDCKAVGRVLDYQRIAEYMFRPEGIILNFGKEDKRYIAFERSASMSRANQLSFICADVYESLRERMMLGMNIGKCQLSKLYAYNALLFTSGKRHKESDAILNDKKIIVIKNPESVIENIKTVTVNGDGSNNAVRKYTRIEETKEITIIEFDGEGFISPRLADLLDKGHNSFQIRMPYIKGVVHKVDFAALLSELEVPFIVDIWDKKHNPAEVDIILTESMFKGLEWMSDNDLSWAEYLERCKKYNHALYVSGKDKVEPQDTTELNYQFLNTLSISDDEFRPKELPFGWKDSPEYDSRHWITKTTETEYYRLVADNEARRRYFTDKLGEDLTDDRRNFRAELISKNALFIDEPIYAKELKDKAENLLGRYAMGKLLVAGDNRYLSDDLLRIVAYMVKQSVGEGSAYHRLEQEFVSGNFMYAPQPSYEKSDYYTILRSPHIARNEEVLVKPMLPGELREKYFSHLSYVIMVDSRSLIPERLGGADFDGDMVKTIADPLVNKCVMRSSTELPLLKIPTEKPLKADANDWYERFITVKNTFSSRVGQISNAALNRGIIAYDENTADEDKERYYHEVEILAILTGLEIDSAKSGVKPDLSEYIEKKNTHRSIFLRYKAIVGSDESHKWYEPSKNARLKKYFDSIDWNKVSSNLEKLPYLAYMLERETEVAVVSPVSDEQLFTFAQTPDWKEKLDSTMLNRVSGLIADYETALSRVRYIKHISMDSNKKVATVNEDTGLVIAQGPGTATITATACDGSGKKDTLTVVVRDEIKVTGVQVTPRNLTLKKGERHQLCAEVLPSNADNPYVRWYSGNTSIATVDEYTGCVTAKGLGKVAIYAYSLSNSNIEDWCCVTVKSTPKPQEEKPKTTTKESNVADPVDAYSGAHLLTNTLMTLFGGQSLKLTAHYNSTNLASGVMGVAWYHNYEKQLKDLECEIRVYSSPSTYLTYTCNDDCTVYTCTAPSKNGYVLTVDCSQQYPYILNCNHEYTEYYNSDGLLTKIVNHQGFETLITYAGALTTITDTVSGKKIYLEKNNDGKLVRVYDDAEREAFLSYEGNFLTDIMDLNGNSLKYTYNEEGCVLTGTDSKNICYFTNTYDECGRVLTQKDGITNSLLTNFKYNDDGTRITTNRNSKNSMRQFDENGWLIKYVDENENSKTYTYDERGNITAETDANGNSITKVYNSFNKPTEIIDKNGNKTCIEYDLKGNVTKIIYPAINGVSATETFVYNQRNQLLQHKDVRDTITIYEYDAAGMPKSKKVGTKNAIIYSYENGLLKSQTDAMGYTTQYGHNAIGQVITKTDAKGKVTSYEYDACGNLLKTTDAEGKTVENIYDGNHQKTSVKDANGNITTYAYNGNMKNSLITLPDGKTISYEFDGEDRPVKVTDQANNVTTTQYDKSGRVISKHLADGGIVQYEYDKVGNVVKEINPNGAVTVKTYDGNGNVLSQKDNAGNIIRYDYDAMNRVVRAVNSASGACVYEYSKAGDLLSETDALGNKKTYTYDAFGNKLTATDAKGNVTSYTFDANDNLLTVKDALNNITTYTYNSLNQLVSVKDAKNNTVTYGYDALGRRTTITDAKNNVFTTTYDGSGNVLKTIDAKGNTISETVYNCLNKPASVTDAMGKTTTYTYTALGKVESVVDSLNNRQEFTYDSMGRNTVVRDALNNTSTAEYDMLGNVTKLVGPLGGATNYSYDQMGRLISESTSSGGTITYGYNALNIKEQLTNARGQVRKFFYDAMGRITGFVGAEDSVSYTYDDNGNVLTVSDKNGVIKREYDALNRIIKLTDTFGKTIQYTYDAVGNLASIIYPDNTVVNYTYDANNNLVSVTDWANRVTSYTYDVNNMVVGVTKPDGSVTTTVYDNAQRVVSTVEKTASNVVITGFEYTYDNLSRIVEEKHLADNTKICYTYDNLSRVTNRTIKNECDCVISSENFTYDAAGNITDAPNSYFIYDTNNRLITFNGNTVSYDMDGNMLSNGYINCEFDSGNRLISAGGHTYTYNAEDVRIRNLCADADTTYTYNTNCKLSQLLQKTTNGITTKYVYGLGLIGEEKECCFKTYHFDYRGSTVAITDECGNITDTFKYDAYGKLVSRTGNSFVIFGYNGRDGVVTDKNGLIYMRARYYSPDMRRFINADIISGEISNAITLNRYAYANGNPVSNTDPFGLSVENRGSVDFDSLYEILKKIKSQKDSKIATNMLANTLDQLMSFKNIFKISNGMSFSFPIGVNAEGSFSVEASSGKGNAEISAVVSEQIDILGSISFDANNVSISLGTDKSVSIGYSVDLDDYNTVVASISWVPGLSLSAGYAITTTDNYDNSVSTSFELTHFNENDSKPNKAPQLETVPSTATDFGWGLRLAGLGLLIWGVANNVTGVGFGDDLVTIPTAIAMLFGKTA